MPSALWALAHAIEASAMRLEGKQYYDIARALRREAVSTGELAFELDKKEDHGTRNLPNKFQTECA